MKPVYTQYPGAHVVAGSSLFHSEHLLLQEELEGEQGGGGVDMLCEHHRPLATKPPAQVGRQPALKSALVLT